MKRLALLLPLLAACQAAEITDSDVIRFAPEPTYFLTDGGDVAATRCRSDRTSGYSELPSGCQRDLVFAAQVANQRDLIKPRQPGPAPAAPIAIAAEKYLYGEEVPPDGRAPEGGAARIIQNPAPQPEG